MKLVHSVALIVAALSTGTVALPNTYKEVHPLFNEEISSPRFEVTSHDIIDGLEITTVKNTNLTARYVIPEDLQNWPWWCSEDRSYCGASWAPTVAESNSLAKFLEDKGAAGCTISRAKNSKADGYTSFKQVNSHAKVGGFFTHFTDTDRAHKVTYRCVDLAYILKSLIEACQCQGRVVGTTPLPNCWIESLEFTGDQKNPPGGQPGAGVGIAPYP